MNFGKFFTKFFLAVSIFLFVGISLIAKTITIFSVNDFHGKLDHNDTYNSLYPGITILLNEVNQLKKAYSEKDTIIVAGGDNYVGSVLSFATRGAPVSDMYKAMGVVASAVGNHELDWGQGNFEVWQKSGGFSYVACNIFDKNTNKIVSWAKPFVMIERDGVKIAFIGLTTIETETIVSKKKISNLEFRDPAASAQPWIDYLKDGKDPQGKPDVIILLTHIPTWQEDKDGVITGDEIHKLYENINGVDAIFTGHSHKFVCGEIGEIPVIQAECFGECMGILKIDIDDKTNKIVKIVPKVLRLIYNPEISSEEADKILAKYSTVLRNYDKVIGYAPEDLSKTPRHLNSIGIFMARTMAQETNSQIGLTNAFGIRCEIFKGPISLEVIYNLMPFDDNVISFEIKGEGLKKVIEHGIVTGTETPLYGFGQFWGLKVKFDSSKPYGSRVISMSLLNGELIEMDKYYKMATSDFVYNGGDGFDFTGTKNEVSAKESFRNMIIGTIEKQKGIFPMPADGLVNIASDTSR